MGKRTWIAAAAVAALGAAMSTSAAAYTSVGVQIGVPAPIYVNAPPAPVREYTPAHRRGHVWVPGHWEWQGNGHVWVQGHFIPERRWARNDQDRDGIPNRYDRDRDGDGVANRYDRAPDNRYRR
ncbi:MAG TPA: YXWGXW repeat-containing protein [Ramlibacter sp.]|nr:YXWGXW repeat-containing protein [Ramlibacter sp.]